VRQGWIKFLICGRFFGYFLSVKKVIKNHAINREKQLKNWRRAWKETLINEMNPDWNDLSLSFRT
jgi:predicted GIY-YIG superfamily endonuclease